MRHPAGTAGEDPAGWQPVRDPVRDKLLCEYCPALHAIRVRRGRETYVAQLPGRGANPGDADERGGPRMSTA